MAPPNRYHGRSTPRTAVSAPVHRSLLTALQGLEGAGVGASVGSNLTGTSAGNPILVGGGAGVGLLLGLGYAVCRRGGGQPGTGRHLRGCGRDDVLPSGTEDRTVLGLPGSGSLAQQTQAQGSAVNRLTGVPMPDVVSMSAVALRSHVLRPALLGLAFTGCGPAATLLGTKVLPEPEPPAGAQGQGLPQAYPRSQINDPRLRTCAQEFETWALQQRSPGADPVPPFLRVEVLPPTRTILPYGVGAFQQERRLPAILTDRAGMGQAESG